MSLPVRIIVYAAAGYAVICAAVFFLQRRLLYHPDAAVPSGAFLDQTGLTPWPDPGEPFRGYLARTDSPVADGFVMVFHGNAGTAADRGYYGRMLGSMGFRVILAEYPGTGGRTGKLTERNLVKDAHDSILEAVRLYGKPVVLVGESLGCGVAAGAAANPRIPVDGVILITPWDSLPSLGQEMYRFLPVRLLALDRYDNIRNLESFRGRAAVAIAEKDEVIHASHGMRLFESLDCQKRLWMWPEAGHNSWPDAVGAEWWREVMEFIRDGE